MRQIILAGVSVLALAISHAGQAQTTAAAFDQGLADRASWERWTTNLSGPALDGATFWSGQRSLPHPGTCTGPAAVPAEWTQGCMEAQQRLALSDLRRKTEPDYKSGWNSWTPTSTTTPPQPIQVAASSPVPITVSPPSPTSQPVLSSADAYKAIFGEARQRKADEAARQADAQQRARDEAARRDAEAIQEASLRQAELAERQDVARREVARRDEEARNEAARREAATRQEAETRAAAQMAAENAADNFCRKPAFAGDLLASFTKLLHTMDEAGEAIDIEHLTTVKYNMDQGVWSCHGVFVLSSGRRMAGLLSSRLNIAGKPLVNFHAD